MSIATQLLAKVEQGRWQKAVEAWASGIYRIIITGQSEGEVRGYVRNGDTVAYGVVLTPGQAFCSCKDAMYRKGVTCKHALALALAVIRTPQAQPQAEAR